MIIGYIKGQELQLKSELIVADTIDYLTAKFVFKTADWQGLSKWAHFKKGSTVYDIPLTADGITKDKHLNLSDGEWEVYLHGNAFDGGEVVERITTEVAKLTVKGTGSLNGEPFPEIPASETERINAELADHEERIDALEQGGGGGGTSDHTQLTNRAAANQHPMSAISGLEDALDSKQPSGDYATSGELDALANIVDGKADAADIPSLDGYATEQWVENKGYLTEHQSLAAYRTASAQDVIDNGKVDKVSGKGLSTNDYTNEDKAKVASAVQPSDLNDYIPKVLGDLDGNHAIADSDYIPMAEAPDGDAQKVNVEAFKQYINNGMASQSDLDEYAKTADVPTRLSQLSGDSTHRVVTDAEKSTWNGKQDAIGYGNKIVSKFIIGAETSAHFEDETVEKALDDLYDMADAKLDISDLTDYALKTDLPQNVSDLTNDSGYLTLSTLPIYNGGVE